MTRRFSTDISRSRNTCNGWTSLIHVNSNSLKRHRWVLVVVVPKPLVNWSEGAGGHPIYKAHSDRKHQFHDEGMWSSGEIYQRFSLCRHFICRSLCRKCWLKRGNWNDEESSVKRIRVDKNFKNLEVLNFWKSIRLINPGKFPKPCDQVESSRSSSFYCSKSNFFRKFFSNKILWTERKYEKSIFPAET